MAADLAVTIVGILELSTKIFFAVTRFAFKSKYSTSRRMPRAAVGTEVAGMKVRTSSRAVSVVPGRGHASCLRRSPNSTSNTVHDLLNQFDCRISNQKSGMQATVQHFGVEGVLRSLEEAARTQVGSTNFAHSFSREKWCAGQTMCVSVSIRILKNFRMVMCYILMQGSVTWTGKATSGYQLAFSPPCICARSRCHGFYAEGYVEHRIGFTETVQGKSPPDYLKTLRRYHIPTR